MIKKRNRPSLICTNCRYKRKKCNRELPCSGCLASGMESTCAYTVPQKKANPATTSNPMPSLSQGTNDLMVNRTLEDLKVKIKELETTINKPSEGVSPGSRAFSVGSSESKLASPSTLNSSESSGRVAQLSVSAKEDTISFLSSFKQPARDDSKEISYPYRPLQFIFLSKRDKGAKLFFEYQASLKNFAWSPATSQSSTATKLNSEALEQNPRQVYGAGYIKKVGKHLSETDRIELKNAVSVFGTKLGLTFCTKNLEGITDFSDRITSVLPIKSAVHELLQVFFKTLYPYFPFVDEDTFKSDIERIVIFKGEKPSKINIREEKDLAIISMLLTILRLSYLSKFSIVVSQNEKVLNPEYPPDGTKLIFLNPVSLDAIVVANECLMEFDLTSNQPLIVLQAATFMKIYRDLAPEEGSGYSGGESSVFNGILIQMANSMSLNRDPDHFVAAKTDEKSNNIKRKIWHFLVLVDIEDSVIFGTPILTVSENSDTRLPFYCDGNSNITDIDLERQIIKSYEYLDPIVTKIHKILEMILLVKSAPKVSVLLSFLDDLESSVAASLGQLNDYLVSDSKVPDFMKIMKLRLYLHCKVFLAYTYYCFHVYYEEKGQVDTHLFYLRKSLTIIFCELAGITSNLLENSDDYFASTFTLILTPVFEVFCRMELVINSVMTLRINSSIITLAHEPFYFNLPDQYSINIFHNLLNILMTSFRLLGEKLVLTVSMMGERYYLAWRSRKTYKLLLKLLNISEVYQRNCDNTRNARLNFSVDDLYQLIEQLKLSSDTKQISKNGATYNQDGFAHSPISMQNSPEFKMNEAQLENLWAFLSSFKRKSKFVQLAEENASFQSPENDSTNNSNGDESAAGTKNGSSFDYINLKNFEGLRDFTETLSDFQLDFH